jgi:hypothetical protein
MHTPHHLRASAGSAIVAGPSVIMLTSRATLSRHSVLAPAAMAQHLRETNPASARCFALEMREQVAWANEEWGEYWEDVARLV